MGMSRYSSYKIVDASLRRFAALKTAKPQTVIVELGAEPPQLGLRETTPRPRKRLARKTCLKDVEGHASEMDQLEVDLKKIDLPEKPIRLDAAQAFLVTLTPAQLRQILDHPLVGNIRPNRIHHA